MGVRTLPRLSCLRISPVDNNDGVYVIASRLRHLTPTLQGQQRVEKALEEVRMLTKNLLKGQVILWIQVAHAGHHTHWL